MKRLPAFLVLATGVVLLLTWPSLSQIGRAAASDRENPIAPTSQPVSLAPPADWPQQLQKKVEPALLKQALEGTPDDQIRFIVELAHQADLASWASSLSHVDRRQRVVTQLQHTARQTQAGLLTFLEERQSVGQVQQFRSFWIFNGLAVTADVDSLLSLAARPEVRFIRQDRWQRWVAPSSAAEARPNLNGDNVEWNIAQVRADLAWNALRLDGSDVTVAIMDTGVDWQHPALQTQYRGYKPGGLAVHKGNWHCTTDEGYLYPVDGNGHGTHVAGIAVGGQGAEGQAIGVAPGARWIAVKMLSDGGYGYDSWIHAAFEWIMAPDGDPALAPDIVNGSWGNPDAGNEVLRADLQALRAAGIVPVFAAGNNGPYTPSIQSPASYPEVIAVGATDDLDKVTTFSSRGPSPWKEVKPEVVAPGAQIRSSLPGGTYAEYSGTSMAVPHVAGLVALLLQADPTLTVDAIEEILTSTALPLGTEVPNNDSGWGRIDAYQAAAVALQAGFIAGQVTRHPDQQPLPTAQISVFDHLGEQRAKVPASQTGHYHLALPPGQYTLNVEAFGYGPRTVANVVVQTALTHTVDVTLSPLPTGVLWGQVRDAETGGPVGAALAVVGTPAYTTSDPQTGQYSLSLPEGPYTLQVTQNGYQRYTIPGLEIVADQATRLDVALAPAPTLLLVDSGLWYYGSQIEYFEQALDDGDYVYDTWEIRDLETDLPELSDLEAYDITIWSAPYDAPGLIGAGDTISNYLGTGGDLFLTGQDVGFWDGGLSALGWHDYYIDLLNAQAVDDDAGRGDWVGLPGEILHGLSLAINAQDSAANQSSPDSIAVWDPRDAAIIGHYSDGGGAGLRASRCQLYRAVYLAAGLEGLGSRATRAEAMDRVLTWLGAPHPTADVELFPPHQEEVWLTGTSVTYTLELRNSGQFADRFTLELASSGWDVSVWDDALAQPIESVTVDACQTQTLGLKVSVPPNGSWNITNVVTLTARSQTDPLRTAQATILSKAPAPILLVDDHRWYDMLDRYRAALDVNHLPYDVWTLDPNPLPDTHSPSLQRLQRYPVVIWFTAYDWYATLMPSDEARLAAYLDGGGRLLLSSQDYLYTSEFSDFARNYLGVAGYTEGMTVTQIVGAVGSPINVGPDPMDLTYPFPNFSDALRPAPGTQQAYWGQHGQPAALTLERMPWKTVFFAFPLEALDAPHMAAVTGEAVDWLSPLGDSSLTVDQPVVDDDGQLAYTLTIQNTGPAPLSNATLSNTVPLSTTYVAGSLEGPATYDPGTKRFVWNGPLASGQTITIRYRLRLNSPLPDGTVVRNVARLRDESGLTLDRVAVSRVNTPELSRSIKVVSDESAVSGQTLTYTLALRNHGARSTHASLVDPAPPQTTYLPGLAWASSGLLTSTTETLLWAGPIAEGQVVTITFPVQIDPTIRGLYILNRATVNDGWGDAVSLEAYTWVEIRLLLPVIFK